MMTPHPCTVHNSPLCQSIKLVHGFKHAASVMAIAPTPEARQFIQFALLAAPEPDDQVVVAVPKGDGHRARLGA